MGNRASSACFDEDSALIPTMCGGGADHSKRTDRQRQIASHPATSSKSKPDVNLSDTHGDDIIHLEDLDLNLNSEASKSNDMAMIEPSRRGAKKAASTSAQEKTTVLEEDERDEQPASKPNKEHRRKKSADKNSKKKGAATTEDADADDKGALDAALADFIHEIDGSDEDTRSGYSSVGALSLGFHTTASGSVNRDARIDMGTSRCSTDGRDECSSFMEGGPMHAAQSPSGRAHTRGLPPLGRRLEDSREQDP